MSCADEEGCFTFTWEIENFDIFLRAEKGELSSPAWKTETTEGKAVEWQVLVSHCPVGTDIRFQLICLNEIWYPDRCESSAISSCGKILPTSPKISVLQSVVFRIDKEDMFDNKMKPNIPLNCLTVECKMWRNSMKNGECRIRSVVKKVIFCECILDTHFFSSSSSPYSHNKIIEKEDVRINMILDNKHSIGQYYNCALALTIIDGCFSFVHCNVACDWKDTTQQRISEEYNDLRTEYRKECRILKQSGETRNANCKFSLQLDTIVAHHNNCQCPMTYPTSSRIVKTGDSSEAVNDPLKDLLRLYEEGILSDVTINTEGKSFSAHRNILAVRSPVFRAMFEKDEMSEGRLGVVDVDDMDSETMDRLLVFLYGDSLHGLQWGEAAPLYYAADKYAVQPLKQKCANILKARMTLDNVCDALVLADTHSDEHLMKWAVDFINDHQEVVSSPDWQQLEESKPRLVVKITKELFLKRVNK